LIDAFAIFTRLHVALAEEKMRRCKVRIEFNGVSILFDLTDLNRNRPNPSRFGLCSGVQLFR